MSASRQELQPIIDQLLDLLDVRMSKAGQVTLHFNEVGQYQRAQVNYYVPPGPDRPLRRSNDLPMVKAV